MQTPRYALVAYVKFSGGISDVGHQSVARSLHPDGIINLCAIGASPLRKQSAIIEKTHHQSRGVAQPGSAPALGAGGRRFKSYRPDQSFQPSKLLMPPLRD